MSSPTFAVVIATHIDCYPLERCIEGHLALCKSPEDLIFVDNGSGGLLAKKASKIQHKISTLVCDRNGFFCGGYNAGLRHAMRVGYDYVLIVNADTEVVDQRYVDVLIEVAELYPRAAFIGPRVLNGDRLTVQNTIMTFPWVGQFLTSWLASFLRQENKSANQIAIMEADFLNGVCVLCRTKALDEIGLMDEVMGGYVEDADWSWRARQAGWISLFVPQTSVLHHQVPNEYRHYSLKTFMLRRNHVYWHKKNGRQIQAFSFACASSGLAFLRCIVAVFKRDNPQAHWFYLRKHIVVVWRIIRGDEVGEWFGPPLGDYQ